MTKIRPFADEDGYTSFSNYMLDVIMPSLPANAWKVLCLIVRKTRGWQKDMDRMSYSQIEAGAGIGSSATVSTAIKVLLDKQLIVKVPGNPWTSMGYRINSALEIEVLDDSTLETEGHDSTSKTEALCTLEIEVPALQKLKTQKERSKERSKEKRERHTPAQTGMSNFSEAVQVYKELSGIKNVAPVTADKIADTVTDIPHWRNVIPAWIGAGLNPKNTDGMLDWYTDPSRLERRNGHRNGNQHLRQSANGHSERKPQVEADPERGF